jgi:hypothetical protein
MRKHGLRGSWRFFFRWRQSLKPGASSVRDQQPWITYPVIDYLKGFLRPEHRVFEYGGGGSTLFFVKRVAEVVTVEHNQEWFKILSETINMSKKNSWTGKFVGPAKGDLVPVPDPSDPSHYSSADVPSKGYNYRKYASAIDEYPENYYDCVVVDGRSRPACMMHAIPKIRKGGLLVLDNSDREYYMPKIRKAVELQFETIIDGFAPGPYSQDFTKTTVWRKK